MPLLFLSSVSSSTQQVIRVTDSQTQRDSRGGVCDGSGRSTPKWDGTFQYMSITTVNYVAPQDKQELAPKKRKTSLKCLNY